jgi:polysaccharide export outer membrane protein
MRTLTLAMLVSTIAGLTLLTGCAGGRTNVTDGAGQTMATANSVDNSEYMIGPDDQLQVFVWRNPELSTTVPVRPDGRISVPLVEDMPAVGKTPAQLARDLEGKLKQYVQDPIVNVIVTSFNGPFAQQIRVVGEAAKPQAIAYRANMSLLDVMISVGGLTKFASGNRAVIVRQEPTGQSKSINVRLSDLLKDGDVSANTRMLPGDVLIIPQSWF